MPNQPILILGVHRSGTSVLSRIVQDLGVYMGYRQDSHAESTFFQRLNRRLDQECGGHWSTPGVAYVGALQASKDPQTAARLRAYVEGLASLEYWGPGRMCDRAGAPWGWKDPRTAHLLPIWMELYPDARVIWIERHPGASALSLYVRTTELRRGLSQSFTGKNLSNGIALARRLYRGQPILSDALRIQSIDDALSTVLDDIEVHRSAVAAHVDSLLRLRYEDLVTDRKECVAQIAAFLGTPSPDSIISNAAERLSGMSRDRYLQSSEVRSALDRQRSRLSAAGFSA